LVISIPLGYFAGIGAASRHGILFKGGNYIDAIANVDTVVFDKTGTLSTGEFAVVKTEGLSEEDINMVVSIERTSNHPIAKALIKSLASDDNKEVATDVKDIAGYGLQKGEWLVGTTRLLDKRGIAYPESLNAVENTTVVVARSGKYIGMISLADTLKEDAKTAIANINAHTEILSGDRQSTVDYIAREIGVSRGYGDLLPQDKVSHIEKLKAEGRKVAFVGDGINDAPVLALSDVGIAMGAIGSDMAIETADIVIETDQPSKVAKAIEIAKRTRTIVVQNIAFAIGVKLLVMVLGIFDIASLWAAVFADTGVTLLAVLNSMRILIKK
jgi:Cd2+/Zn2+-exporting ATPase